MYYELESWAPLVGLEAECAERLRQWFEYVREHREHLFAEMRQAHYYREVLRERDEATGRWLMQFGYESQAGRAAYKERRKDWSGPYAEYKLFDPYPLFELESVAVSHWAEHERELWLDWQPTDPESFFDVVTWTPLPGAQAEHDAMMRRWFGFIREHHGALFPEWRAAHYFRGTEPETGRPLDRYRMVFEYNSRDGFLAYKERRKDYAGPYAEYLKIDPFVYFDMTTKTQEFWQPDEFSRWLEA